jgi:hypothetical protein
MRVTTVIVAVLGAAIAYGGVGATPTRSVLAASPSRTAAIAGACTLLTKSDVQAVAGTSRMTHRGTQGPFTTCDYLSKAGPFIFLVADERGIKAYTPYHSTAAYWHSTVTAAVVKKKISVKHLGSAAVWMPEIGGLWVLRGGVMFNVAHLPVHRNTLGVLEKLATRVLKHLK